jgi:hypothetical protein
MNYQQKLIDSIDGIIESNKSLTTEEKNILGEVKEALKKAKSKEEVISALKPLAYLFQLIKAITEIFS